MPFLSRALLMLCAGTLPLAAGFVPPAEGPVPFRRDKLPVDVETMTALARQLTLFTGARVADDPDELRAVAQMVALALALDPVSREARALIATLKAGGVPPAAADDELEGARNRAWQVLAWLAMPEAGADGQALAACLGDVMAMADPHHPKARERRAAGERGAWKGWVADESAFRTEETGTEPNIGPAAAEPDRATAKTLVLKKLASPMPLWYFDKESKQMRLGMVPVQLQASISDPEDGDDKQDGPDGDDRKAWSSDFQVQVPGEGMTGRFSAAMRRVETAMTERHGSLPRRMKLELDFGKIDYSLTRNGFALTGTTALLVDGALSGKLPAATTLAVIGEDGKLELPPRLWQTLRTFAAQASGTRLILPAEAADFLTALVVMDEAAFFLKNEVLLAGTVEELCDFASPTPGTEFADGLKRFDEIRNAGQGRALGTFVAFPSTQERLREVTGVMPGHASARMLALQGSGSRPRFLQRPILAREIRSALEPLGYFAELELDDLDAGPLEAAQKASRAELDGLVDYIDTRDRDLHKAASDLADSVRYLARILSKTEGEGEGADGTESKQREAYHSARRQYIRVLRELAMAAGDAGDFPPPAARGED